MDVLFFLKERTRFIRYYYETAAQPFREIVREIEASEDPFDNPPYSEDSEIHVLFRLRPAPGFPAHGCLPV